MNSIERADAFVVFIIQVEATFPLDRVVNTSFLHLKACGVDEEIKFVLFAFKQRSLLGDFGNTFASGVYEVDIRTVVR